MVDLNILKNRIQTVLFKYSEDTDKKEMIEKLKQINDDIIKFEKNNALIKTDNTFLGKAKKYLHRFFNKKAFTLSEKQIEDFLNETAEIYKENIIIPKIKSIKYFKSTSSTYEKIKEAIRANIIYDTRLVKTKNDCFKLYPITLDNVEQELFNKELDNISYYLFTTNKTEKDISNEILEKYQLSLNSKKKEVYNGKLEPYYGSPDFMYQRANYIFKCIKDIIASNDIDEEYKELSLKNYVDAKEIIANISANEELIRNFDLSQKEKYVEVYNNIEKNYLQMLSIEEEISKDISKIWKDFLTDPKEYKEGDRFAFLVHAFNPKDIVNPDSIKKLSCTLITNNCIPIPENRFGIICNPTMEQISGICVEDASSWVVDKEYFLDKNMPVNWQFAEEADENRKIFYENPEISKIILPQILEREVIKSNLEVNPEILNYTRKKVHSEIFVKKAIDVLDIPAIFYFSNNTNFLNKNKLDNSKDFPENCIEINLNELRKQHDLKPIKTNSIEK